MSGNSAKKVPLLRRGTAGGQQVVSAGRGVRWSADAGIAVTGLTRWRPPRSSHDRDDVEVDEVGPAGPLVKQGRVVGFHQDRPRAWRYVSTTMWRTPALLDGSLSASTSSVRSVPAPDWQGAEPRRFPAGGPMLVSARVSRRGSAGARATAHTKAARRTIASTTRCVARSHNQLGRLVGSLVEPRLCQEWRSSGFLTGCRSARGGIKAGSLGDRRRQLRAKRAQGSRPMRCRHLR